MYFSWIIKQNSSSSSVKFMHETSRASHYDTHVLFLIKKNEVGAT